MQKRLKENVPLAQIRKEMRENGYDSDDIGRAVNDAISNAGKNFTHMTQFQIIVIAIGLVAVLGVIWQTSSRGNGTFEICNKFDVQGSTNCNSAVRVAVKDYPGSVTNVEFGKLLYSGDLVSKDYVDVKEGDVVRNTWFVDINLNDRIDIGFGTRKSALIAVDDVNQTTLIYQLREDMK